MSPKFRIPGKVIFGTTLKLNNINTSTEVTYTIVGDDEADINANKISVSSPIARALIGKCEGDIAEVRTPDGTIKYEIIEVEHI